MSKSKLSATALAKESQQEVKAVFAYLAGQNLIHKTAEGWELTSAGLQAGGEYRPGKDQGRYIVWPRSVMAQTAVDRALADKGAQALGERLGLSANQVNLVLLELGWLRRAVKGWRLTEAGRALGGTQHEVAETGVPYVKWPSALQDNRHLREAVARLRGELSEPPLGQAEADYRARFPARHLALDGHRLRTAAEARVDNWLYLAGLRHAVERRLPIEGEAYAGFYLPEGRVYIEVWGEGRPARYRAEQAALYEANDLRLIELGPEDLEQLDEVLARALLRLEIAT